MRVQICLDLLHGTAIPAYSIAPDSVGKTYDFKAGEWTDPIPVHTDYVNLCIMEEHRFSDPAWVERGILEAIRSSRHVAFVVYVSVDAKKIGIWSDAELAAAREMHISGTPEEVARDIWPTALAMSVMEG